MRAVVEGVAFGLRDSFDLLRELGVRCDRARISGGGARGDLWRTIVASVLTVRPAVGGRVANPAITAAGS